jgi:hypothetical protein
VRAGDRVKSRDPQTGGGAKTGKAETLTYTPEHPLFVTGQGCVEAGSLGIGSSIVSRAGPALAMTSVAWQRNAGAQKAAGSGSKVAGSGSEAVGSGAGAGSFTVYNLMVEDDHTYFVGNTGGGTWVHNVGCTIIGRIEHVDAYIEKFPEEGPFNRYNPAPEDFKLPENMKWLQDAVDRGDRIISASDPWTLGQRYIPNESNGYYTGLEIKALQSLGKSVYPGWLKL